MEKKKKGLFGRLLEFWQEKTGRAADGIGFWNGKEDGGNYFAEMGAVASLSQRETEQIFRAGKRKKESFEEALENREKQKTALFAAEVFPEKQEEKNGRMFLWEAPVEEKAERKIISVTEKTVEKKELSMEEEQPQEVFPEREGTQTAPEVDIEKLMGQITKKLWEERESCGRRLR